MINETIEHHRYHSQAILQSFSDNPLDFINEIELPEI